MNYNTINEYLKGLKFLSPHTPEIFFNREDCQSTLAVDIDVKCASASDNLFDVTLVVNLSPSTADKEFFSLEIEYSSLVVLSLPGDADEAEKRHVLMVEVPQSLYPIVRDLVAHLTFRSGFPPVVLKNFDFELNYQSTINNAEAPADSCLEELPYEELSYQTLVSGFTDTKEGEEFVQTCVTHGMNPDLEFEDTPLYKYLLRFIEVPDFNIPQYEDTYVEWPFFEGLFRMLATNENASYRFVDDEVSELYFTYGEWVDKPISELNICELDSLATSLIIDSWVNYNVALSQIFPAECQSKADAYLNNLAINQMITKDEYFGLFKQNANPVTFEWCRIECWYQKLQKIDISTIKYRF